MKHRLATQDYIKSIATLSLKEGVNVVKLKWMASKLNVTNAAVCDMVKKLVKEGLVINHAYKGIELTDQGWFMGRRLIRHHRLWEVFLYTTLNVPWDEIHEEAEHLEHAASDALMNRIDEYLGFPTTDPHGNPIPNGDGTLSFNANEQSLNKVSSGEEYVVTRFESLDAAYLQYLTLHGFAIGVTLKIIDRFDFDQSVVVDMSGTTLQLSCQICQQIFVLKSTD